MAVSKPKKAQRTAEDEDLLKSDVASFASSLGLAAVGGTFSSSGFDDSDFRKSGPINPQRSGKNLEKSSDLNQKPEKNHAVPRPNPKPHPLDLDPFTSSEKKKGLPKLPLMKASLLSGHWYVDADELEIKVLGEEGRKKVPALGIDGLKALAGKKKEIAEGLMEQYSRDYDVSRRNKGDMRLLEVTARSGTSADKVSAFTCLVEDNPIANMRSLDALLSMVTSKVGKRYAFTGFEALRELFLLRLLPDRKLKSLLQHPLDELPETKDGFSLLLFWYWEECLKQRYERFVIALEEALKDMLPTLKDKAMKTVYILLKSKPEQERKLLAALVNKLGDPERKAASGAAYHLSCLLSAHPNMKAVVIDEVDSFIFRPHIGLRAKYQAVNFLSQIFLSSKGDGPKVAKRLVDVYFALFKVLISDARSIDNRSSDKGSKKGNEKGKLTNKKKPSSLHNNERPIESIEMDSRLLSALLTGVNRAFPYVTSDEADDILEVQMPILFKLVHAENFNVGVQALMLLYQISSKNQILSDRFYRALYSKLLTPAALKSSKPEMFLGLLFKAMKSDVNLKRVSAFSKRLLQVSLQRPAQYACGCLFLLSEVLKAKPPLWSMALQNESVDDDFEHFEDIIEEPQNSSGIPPSKAPGNFGTHAASFDGEKPPASYAGVSYDSDGEGNVNDGTQFQSLGYANKGHTRESSVGYDPRHREPSYCNADRTSWWELTILATHVHPSVATMARTLLSGANIVYNGDPLNDLSLGAFLDKFMEKKPKANRRAEGKWHGGSQIAPARKLDMNHHLIGDEILQLAEEEVPPEDVVFHRFYMNKTTSSKRPKAKKKASEDEDAEDLLPDINDESDEEEIDDMLGSGKISMDDETEGFDYDDLDELADEDDDLLGNGSDTDVADGHTPEEHPKEQINEDDDDDGNNEDFDDVLGVDSADSDDDDDDDDDNRGTKVKKSKQVDKDKKRKRERKARPSPFASAEEFEHLMADKETKTRKKSSKLHKPKKNKKSD